MESTRTRRLKMMRIMSESEPIHGKPWTEPFTDMEFAWVPGGTFEMGDMFGDGEFREKPLHTVYLDGFWLGKYPVTQTQWERVIGSNPSYFQGPDNPVECVSWVDVQEFIQRLNGRKSIANFRMLTEAEWEYACRSGGKPEKYSGGGNLDSVAWYKGNSGGKTHPVGEKLPNALGIHDMSGNVWEWVSDWYGSDYYAKSPRNNPQGPTAGSSRVYRGGSWRYSTRACRATYRGNLTPGGWNYAIGFRLALSPGQQ